MSWEFGIILTDAPNPCGGFGDLPRTANDDFAGEWIIWDDGIDGYSGWNLAAGGAIARDTNAANFELLTEFGNQAYVKLSERVDELDSFEAQLQNIRNPDLRGRCEALIAGCRSALARDPERAVLLIF
jgi:hypothetical protein